MLTAIELLLDGGDFKGADQLYQRWLSDGNIFKWLPAPAEGLRCALGFVRDADRRQACEIRIGTIAPGLYAQRSRPVRYE